MNSFNFCRALADADYALFSEWREVDAIISKHPGLFRYEHQHRKWEYGLALKFMRHSGVKTVLEAGGGGSPLAALLAISGMEVTVADLGDEAASIARQNDALGTRITYVRCDFRQVAGVYGGVTCTSVIEHVPEDRDAIIALAAKCEGPLFVTTDFHPTGKPFSQAHLRTYGEAELTSMSNALCDQFQPVTQTTYHYAGPCVYDYTFGSLALTRKP